MATRTSLDDVIRDAIPFVAIMVLWMAITVVVYGGFLVAWPPAPDAQPWNHLGVFLLPFVGYVGHTLLQVRKGSR